jgi:hypothetical protein
MFRAMFSPIIRSIWLYLQYLVIFTQVAAGWCHGWVEIYPWHQPATTWVNTTRCCKYSQVLLMMGENRPKSVELQFQLIHDTSRQQLRWILPDTVNTVKCSWWWAKTSPEKCRAPVPTHPWHQPAATWVNTTRYCKYSQVLLMVGENIARKV